MEITIQYHGSENEDWGASLSGGGRLISAKIEPYSIKHIPGQGCTVEEVMGIPADTSMMELKINYTYGVRFEENDKIRWSSRWDYILDSMPHTNIVWFNIMNSLVVVLFLSGVVAVIMLRILRKDNARYNLNHNSDESWRSLRAVKEEVFRPPRRLMLLSLLVGSGVQIFSVALITLVCAALGFLSPANRGALMTTALLSYVLLGLPAGYVSARIYKMFGGEKYKKNAILTAFLCPGILFSACLSLDTVYRMLGSSAAWPFFTLLKLVAMWLGVMTPLTCLGAYCGFRHSAATYPVTTKDQAPRLIPKQRFFTKLLLGIIMGGVLPFGCIFIQVFFILNCIWSHQIYYMFGFLFLVFLILVVTCSEATILLCYYHLCAEDYHWWWRAFLTGGFTAVSFFFYCVHYYVSKLEIEGFTSTFLYFGYTLIMTFIFFLLTGTIGFSACYLFVNKIYNNASWNPATEKGALEKIYLLGSEANSDAKLGDVFSKMAPLAAAHQYNSASLELKKHTSI